MSSEMLNFTQSVHLTFLKYMLFLCTVLQTLFFNSVSVVQYQLMFDCNVHMIVFISETSWCSVKCCFSVL